MGLAESCHRFPERGNDGREEEKYGRIESRHLEQRARQRRDSKWKFIEYKRGQLIVSHHAR
jgi:hypothetical protein